MAKGTLENPTKVELPNLMPKYSTLLSPHITLMEDENTVYAAVYGSGGVIGFYKYTDDVNQEQKMEADVYSLILRRGTIDIDIEEFRGGEEMFMEFLAGIVSAFSYEGEEDHRNEDGFIMLTPKRPIRRYRQGKAVVLPGFWSDNEVETFSVRIISKKASKTLSVIISTLFDISDKLMPSPYHMDASGYNGKTMDEFLKNIHNHDYFTCDDFDYTTLIHGGTKVIDILQESMLSKWPPYLCYGATTSILNSVRAVSAEKTSGITPDWA